MFDTKDFLATVITAEKGWFLLAVGNSGAHWHEEWFAYPEQVDEIIDRANALKDDNNVYFSSYLFSDKRSIKECVLPTRTIQADLDEADVDNLPIEPTVLVQTSPGRHQAFWILNDYVDLEVHEILSRKMTYAIPSCDRSGWPLGRKVRFPDTYNHKYMDGKKKVHVTKVSGITYASDTVELLPEVPKIIDEALDEEFVSAPQLLDVGPNELLESFRDKIPNSVYMQYNNPAQDRSAALWALMCALFRAGASRAEVYHLSYHSANNKFKNLRYHAERELAKDVVRAEITVNSGKQDLRAIIMQIRKLPGLQAEKRGYMATVVRDAMAAEGVFMHTNNDECYYIRQDIGRPIAVNRRSDHLNQLLDVEFGLNPTEAEHSYVCSALESHVRGLPQNAETRSMSFFDVDNGMVLLHSHRRDVIKITASDISKVSDGAYNVLFPWDPVSDPFAPNYSPLDTPWYEMVFGGTADQVVTGQRNEALQTLRVWFLFTLMRDAAVSRPILAIFGQPGSGKSTTFRKIFALIYGRRRSLGGISSADDFDYALSSSPLVVIDNADTWERWLPDRLALAVSASDIVKRKLWTDTDTVILKRQAVLGITAHNPKFGREDVNDRLLLFMLKRLPHFQSESEIIDSIISKRPQLWGAICKDLQKVLQTPMPPRDEAPQMRIEDFARVGHWIATALGVASEFKTMVLQVTKGQKFFSLEEDGLLIDALTLMVQKDGDNVQWRNPGAIWARLEALSNGPDFAKQYRNAVYLGKKLWTMADALKEVFTVEVQFDPAKQSRTWRFSARAKE